MTRQRIKNPAAAGDVESDATCAAPSKESGEALEIKKSDVITLREKQANNGVSQEKNEKKTGAKACIDKRSYEASAEDRGKKQGPLHGICMAIMVHS